MKGGKELSCLPNKQRLLGTGRGETALPAPGIGALKGRSGNSLSEDMSPETPSQFGEPVTQVGSTTAQDAIQNVLR